MSQPFPPNEERALLFQQLKPICITISDLALRQKQAARPEALQDALISLQLALASVDDSSLLKPPMADYIFFPLSHILRRKADWTDRVLELTLTCVNLLLETAWNDNLAEQMFEQFCLMLAVITEGKAKKISEDVKAVSVACVVALFQSAQRTMLHQETFKHYVRMKKVRPILGHSATVLLDVIKNEALLKLRLDALKALSIMYTSLLNEAQILAAFLPLTISTLSRCLSSSPGTANHKLIVSLLDLLRQTLSVVMNDSIEPSTTAASAAEESYHVEMTEIWYRASQSQVKIALESFFPFIRAHSHSLVREATIVLSEELLCHCSGTLSDCQTLFLETILMLHHDEFPSVKDRAAMALLHLQSYESLRKVIRYRTGESLYSWTLCLPRTMTSNDDMAKVNLLQRIASAVSYVANDTVNSYSLQELVTAIQGVAIFEENTPSGRIQQQSSLRLTFQDETSESASLLFRYSKDQKVRQALETVLQAVGQTPSASLIVEKLIIESSTDLASNPGNAWIALQVLRGSRNPEEHIHALYSLASDWLTQTNSSFSNVNIPAPTVLVSLDIVAYTASLRKHRFQQELMDILYPTLSLMSHESSQIQSAASRTLDLIARVTEHKNTQALILKNTDYLINSIALRLNVFDVSLQVLATLYTVMRLAGPKVVPYLDDLWKSFFDIVDRFHGYEKLVRAVFTVMTAVVDEILNSVSFLPTPTSEIRTTSHDSVCPEIQDLIDTIRNNKQYLPHQQNVMTVTKPPPLPPKTYSLLQTLSQKSVLLITHPSPTLRYNLITLLQKSLRLLSIPAQVKEGEQDPFLPLLAQEIWPAICSKLLDKEPYVVDAALQAITELLSIEGDFLGSKVEKDVWPEIKRIFKPQNAARGKGKEGAVVVDYGPALKAVEAILMYSNQKAVVFDDMLDVLWPWLAGGNASGLRTVFEKNNADAVWLKELINGQ